MTIVRSEPLDAVRRPRWKLVVLVAAVALAAAGAGLVLVARSSQEGSEFRLQAPTADAGVTFSWALFQSIGVMMAPGHDVEILDNGAVFDALAREISRARASLHLLLYIWEPGVASDRIIAAISERTAAGVECRVLVDDLGSSGFDEELGPRLRRAGCDARTFRPVLAGDDELARNHRKLVIIDGLSAITGGFGIRDNWLGNGLREDEWRDTNVLFRGPAVRAAQQAFAENWQEAGGTLLPDRAFSGAEKTDNRPGGARAALVSSTASLITRAERLTQLSIAMAKRRLWISNAYFVPSEPILDLLGQKASEGVDVRVLTAGKNSDSKTSFGAQQLEYGGMVERGVRVWEYSPSMMHSKTMVVDDDLTLIGSINLEPLSLNKLEEVALVVEDSDTNQRLSRSFLSDCEHAEEQK